MSLLSWFSSAFAAMLVTATLVHAQTTGATLQGTVTDEQSALMPGASVTITNTETGWTRSVVTDERGWYRAIALPPGEYELRAELQGFATYVRKGLTLTTGQEATVNLSLKLATVAETVTVTADAPLVETTKNALGTTVSRSELDSLPLIGRDFAGLTRLSAGITGVGGGGVTASGQTDRSNSYMVDGVSNDQVVTAGQRGGFSLEAVREFAVMANQFTAEFGQASGAVVSVITRSGTNDLRGRAFVFHRDDALDAQDPFSKAQGSGKAPFSQQRYGAFVGGPLIRDRLHYFGTYEGERQRETSVITSALVPVNERETPNPSDGHQAFVKTDQRLNTAQSLSLRYRADKDSANGNSIGGLNSRERGTNTESLVQDIVANHTYVISSRALNELRVQFGRHSTWTNTEGWSTDGMPEISRPSIRLGKAYNQPQGRNENRTQIINNLTYTLSTHEFKGGLDVSIIRAPTFFPRNRDGTFTFTTDRPFDPNDLTTYPTQFTQSVADPWVDLDEEIYAFFAQDSWRARTNLTLNFGIRYDRETAFSTINGVPDDTNNVAPRFGFVWDPTGSGRTAVRGGVGLYVDQVFLNPPLNVVLAQRARDITIVNPGYPDPFTRGSVGTGAPSISVASTNMRTPENKSVSLGVKRELFSGFAVSADGVYSRGYNQFNNRDLNPLDPTTGLRPNPAYVRITQYETEGHAWYSALLMSVERRAGRGPAFGASYTFAKAIRDVEGFLFLAQDQLNPAAEKALATNHRAHQLVAHLTWLLPAGVQVAGLFQARSGQPWNVTTGRDNNGDTEQNDRPDLAVPGGDPRSVSTYFANFSGRVGNLGRNANIGDSFYTLDARVSKFQQIRRFRLEAFIEAFNLLNHVNVQSPTGNLRSASFGRSTQIQGAMRQVELGFRVDF
jgi:Carboxypeptidase regulatory-like domain/TonB dependent receptor-like, beta-barrel